MKTRFLIITLVIFAVLSAVIFAMQSFVPQFHTMALEGGNAIMALLTLSAYFIVSAQMKGSAAAFVRGISGVSFLKIMVCMVAALIYIVLNRSNIHKGTIFALMGIYAIYTAAETLLLSKMARQGK